MLRNTLVSFLALFFSIQLQAKECISLVISGEPHRLFWSELIRGSAAAAQELDIDLHLRGVNKESKERSQILTIKYLMDKYGCKGILLAPAGESLKTTVQQFTADGISFTFIDRDIGGERKSVVKSDNYAAGVMAAQKMALALHDRRKNIALFRLEQGIASTHQRELGFIQEAKKLGLNIIFDEYVGVQNARIKLIGPKFLDNLSNIDGIFTCTGMITEAILKLEEANNLSHQPIHIGFDESEYIIRSVKENRLYGYLKQDSFHIGYYGVDSLYKILHGEEYKSEVEIPVTFITEKDLP